MQTFNELRNVQKSYVNEVVEPGELIDEDLSIELEIINEILEAAEKGEMTTSGFLAASIAGGFLGAGAYAAYKAIKKRIEQDKLGCKDAENVDECMAQKRLAGAQEELKLVKKVAKGMALVSKLNVRIKKLKQAAG